MDSFLEKQHSIFKFFVIIFGIICSNVVSDNILIVIFSATLVMVALSKSILLDFGNLFGEYQTKVAKYYDMSPNMDSDILRLDLFKRLYYIINSLDDDIKSILICDFSSIISQNNKYGSSLYSIYDNIYKIVDGFAKLD